MDPVSAIALTLGAGWASGINLYAAILTMGLAGMTGMVTLPESMQIVQHPLVIGAAGFMYFVNFFTDKVPGVDSASDVLHTFIRIPVGAFLAFAAAKGIQVDPALQMALGLIGGTLAATSHATKTGSRALINTSPEPFSNWAASFGEDVAVIGGLWLALQHPWLFLGILAVIVALTIWLLPKIFRLIARVIRKVVAWFRGEQPAPPPAGNVPPVVEAARRM
jgi:hypothetical protein